MRLSYGLAVLVMLEVVTMAAHAQTQCPGFAEPSTGYTATNDCSRAATALQWALTISCRDGCGQEWTTIGPYNGTASAACSSSGPGYYCSPSWYRFNYKEGQTGETTAYNGAYSTLQGCHKGAKTITKGTCGCAPDCGAEDPVPPPDQCSVTPEVSTSTLGLGGMRSADLTEMPSGFFSDRREVVDGVRYVMEDWAVARVDAREPGSLRLLRVEASSSAHLGPTTPTPVLSVRPAALASDELQTVALVIEKPVHPDNSRMIPTPAVELRPAALPYLGERITAAVRIDVGEDRRIRDTQVLYSTGALPAGVELAEHLETNLRLQYASEKKHRVIVYGIVQVADGRAHLRETQVVLPLCCCNPKCI